MFTRSFQPLLPPHTPQSHILVNREEEPAQGAAIMHSFRPEIFMAPSKVALSLLNTRNARAHATDTE